jgi:hypothetical protein
MEFEVNYLAVLVAAIVQFVVGMAWYSPMLFGKVWMKEMGFTEKDMKAAKSKGMMKEMVIALVMGLVMAYVLSHVTWMAGEVLGSADWMRGLTTGFWMWLGFVGTVFVHGALWEQKSWRLVAINASHWLVALLAMGAVIGAWV